MTSEGAGIEEVLARGRRGRKDVLRALARAAVPLLGIVLLGWSAIEIVGWYFVETLLVGVFNVPRMFAARSPSSTSRSYRARVGLSIFFLLHFGLFVGVQIGLAAGALGLGRAMFSFLESSEGQLAFVALVIGEAASLVGILRRPPEERLRADAQMVEPYTRVFVQQFAVILGGFGAAALGPGAGATWLAVVLVCVRFGIDAFVTPAFRRGLEAEGAARD